MNPKNRLIQYCQQSNIPLPKYDSWSAVQNRKIIWHSTVTIDKYVVQTTHGHSTKSSAERDAAYIMLELLPKINKEAIIPDTGRTDIGFDVSKINNDHIIDFTVGSNDDLINFNATDDINNTCMPFGISPSSTCMPFGISPSSTCPIVLPIDDDGDSNEEEEIIYFENIAKIDNYFNRIAYKVPENTDFSVQSKIKKIKIKKQKNNMNRINRFSQKIKSKGLSICGSKIDPYSFIENMDKMYIIDLENYNCAKLQTDKSSLYIGFINTIHHSISEYKTWHRCDTDDIHGAICGSRNNKLLYSIDGGVKDLADHYMSAFLYPLVKFIQIISKPISVNIVTRDHAGWCTRTCFDKILKWYNMDSNVSLNNIGYI